MPSDPLDPTQDPTNEPVVAPPPVEDDDLMDIDDDGTVEIAHDSPAAGVGHQVEDTDFGDQSHLVREIPEPTDDETTTSDPA